MLDFKALVFVFAFSMLFGGYTPALADDGTRPPASVSENDLSALNADGLFGRSGIASADTSAFTKWNDALKRNAHIKDTAEVRAWHAFLDTLRDKTPAEQIAGVNDYLNRVPYLSDMENYGVADYWATVDEFLARGGDCEDYSIAKYMSLLELGFDARQMRLVILYDFGHRVDHAVLAVTDGGKVDILDNQFASVRDASTISTYKPIYAISQEKWWRFL